MIAIPRAVFSASGTIGYRALKLTAQDVERMLGPGYVGDYEVEQALAGLQPGRLRHDRRRGKARQRGQHLGAHCLTGRLDVVHGLH